MLIYAEIRFLGAFCRFARLQLNAKVPFPCVAQPASYRSTEGLTVMS